MLVKSIKKEFSIHCNPLKRVAKTTTTKNPDYTDNTFKDPLDLFQQWIKVMFLAMPKKMYFK